MSKLSETASIYHSTLVKYVEDNPEGLKCQYERGPHPSKFNKDDTVVCHKHADKKYWQHCENEEVVDAFTSEASGGWIIIQAAGWGEQAVISLTQWSSKTEAESTNGATPLEELLDELPEETAAAVKSGHDRYFLDSLLQANEIIKQYEEIAGEELTENVRTLATNIRMQ